MNNVRGMVEGALFSGIFLVLLLLTIYTPIGLITMYIMPIPFVVYSYRQGIKMGIWVTIASAILSLFIGQVYGLFLGLSAGSVGIVMGYLYHKDSPLPAVVAGVITTLINYTLLLVLGNYLFKTNLVSDLKSMLTESVNSVEKMMSSMGAANNPQSMQMIEAYHQWIDNLDLLMPFLFISSAVLSVLLTHLFASKIMKRLRLETPSFPPFREWSFPKSVIYYYLVTMILLFLNIDNQVINILVINLSPLLQLVLLVQGLSFVFFYAYHKKMGKTLPVIAIIGTVIIPFLGQVLNIIGLMDLAFNLRKTIRG